VPKTSAIPGDATLLDEPGEPFYRPPAAREGEARPRSSRPSVESEADSPEPFLRTRRRVPVRKGILPPWAKTRWGMAVVAVGALGFCAAAAVSLLAARNFAEQDARFRIDSAASIQTVGNTQLSRSDLLSVFGSDIGRNLFFVPLTQRRAELEQLPWVEHATVMRVLPNQLRVAIVERTPIAFVQIKGKIELADAAGVILEMAPAEIAARHYAFPVVSGINPADPLSVRGARMHLYRRFVSELDSDGQNNSAQISQVDLSDPEDIRANVTSGGSDLLLHFGEQDFLRRWRNYQAHIAQWRGQYPNLASVDLRYDHEVVLKMSGTPPAGADAAPNSSSNVPTAAIARASAHEPSRVKPSPAQHHHRTAVRRQRLVHHPRGTR
jgi:cell division protein FtsQ